MEVASKDYVIRVVDNPSAIEAGPWNKLLAAQAHGTLFMRHEYLAALHDSASAVAATGWAPCFFAVYRKEALVAACPAYLKAHSYGEYVFDWAWAEAYQRHGLNYYPKLLVGVPFTPVGGTRLMAEDEAARQVLIRALEQFATQQKLSSAHVLFMGDGEALAGQQLTWMARQTVQFHWRQDALQPTPDFATFLQGMQREKRKKMQQERRRVVDAGVTFTSHEGSQISPALWDFFYLCHSNTYEVRGSQPYLRREFFAQVGSQMAAHWLLFVAHQNGEPVACSLIAIDRDRGWAYGRYWGCTRYIACLHFEACYYQPLSWCMANGLHRFEGGAQGEHKLARGLLPNVTPSAHWLKHPGFADAVQRYLDQEGQRTAAYVDELNDHSPYRSPSAAAP